MALFSRVTTWVSNQVLTAAALNGEFNNLLNNAVSSSYIGFSANVGQMQQQTDPGGVGTESLSGSISDELQRLRFTLAFLSGATYWYDHTGRSLAAGALAVQTADIAALAVTTAKLAATSVTAAKIANSTITGTQIADNVALPGKAASAGGQFLVVSNTNPSTHTLAVIEGRFNATTLTSGEGFTIQNPTPGVYTITFTTAFTSVPTCIAVAESSAARIVVVNTITGSNCTVNSFDTGFAAINTPINFFAIGQLT